MIAVHRLRRGLGRAWVVGDPVRFDAAIVQGRDLPDEPDAFGTDPEAIWGLLQHVEGWTCVNVSPEVAPALGRLIEGGLRTSVRHYGDVYHVLTEPVVEVPIDAVRELTPDDLDLLRSAPVACPGGGFGGPERLLAEGIAVCAIVDERIVTLAQTYARSERHADIGVFTHETWRNRGFATAAAALVACRVQEAGQTPVWSTGEDNGASLRVARKLGFEEVGRRVYLIPAAPACPDCRAPGHLL